MCENAQKMYETMFDLAVGTTEAMVENLEGVPTGLQQADPCIPALLAFLGDGIGVMDKVSESLGEALRMLELYRQKHDCVLDEERKQRWDAVQRAANQAVADVAVMRKDINLN